MNRYGDLIVNAPGVPLSGLDIKGSACINASNVTLINTEETAGGDYVIEIASGVTGTVIQNTTIDGTASRPYVLGEKPVARPIHARIEDCPEGPSPASGMEGRTIGKHSEVYIAFDAAKLKHAVAVAEGGRGEIRWRDLNPKPNSSWIRGAAPMPIDQVVVGIRRRLSPGIFGRPPRERDFQRQYDWKPVRCHR